jgi:hypothetical protein
MALVAATVVTRLPQTEIQYGVYHIHPPFDTDLFVDRLTASGYSIGEGGFSSLTAELIQSEFSQIKVFTRP